MVALDKGDPLGWVTRGNNGWVVTLFTVKNPRLKEMNSPFIIPINKEGKINPQDIEHSKHLPKKANFLYKLKHLAWFLQSYALVNQPSQAYKVELVDNEEAAKNTDFKDFKIAEAPSA